MLKAKGARSSTAKSDRLRPLPSPTVYRSSRSGSLVVGVETTARLTASAEAGSEAPTSTVEVVPATVTAAPRVTDEKAVVCAPVMSLETPSQAHAARHFDKT